MSLTLRIERSLNRVEKVPLTATLARDNTRSCRASDSLTTEIPYVDMVRQASQTFASGLAADHTNSLCWFVLSYLSRKSLVPEWNNEDV